MVGRGGDGRRPFGRAACSWTCSHYALMLDGIHGQFSGQTSGRGSLWGLYARGGACGGQGSSCAKPHSLTNSVQVRRKRTGANILRAPPRRSAKLQQCDPTFETILHGGHAVRGVYAPVTLDAISHAGSGVGAVRPGRLSIAWVVGEGRAGALVRGDGVLRLSRERCAALLWDGLER